MAYSRTIQGRFSSFVVSLEHVINKDIMLTLMKRKFYTAETDHLRFNVIGGIYDELE